MITLNALKFAYNAHDNVNQKYDGSSYHVHLTLALMFANKYIYLIPENFRTTVLNAVASHDLIEDCRITYNDICKTEGIYVANIVYAVTDEKGKTRNERKNDKFYNELKQVKYANFVKLCDLWANIYASFQTSQSFFELYKKEFEHTALMLKTDDSYYEPMVTEIRNYLEGR